MPYRQQLVVLACGMLSVLQKAQARYPTAMQAYNFRWHSFMHTCN
jgi:hypothetical protein